jgi:hypothetical protein
MRLNLKEFMRSLDLALEGGIEETLMTILKRLGYETDDVEIKPTVKHPLFKNITVAFDYGVLKYGDNRYGMVICCKPNLELVRDFEEELCGICALTGALYGVLTNGYELVIIKPKSGVEWEYLDRIPSKDELKLELGIGEISAIAIPYDEFESKVDDLDFVVDNCSYLYSDIDTDEVILLMPNDGLIRWLKGKDVKFRVLSDDELDEGLSKLLFA